MELWDKHGSLKPTCEIYRRGQNAGGGFVDDTSYLLHVISQYCDYIEFQIGAPDSVNLGLQITRGLTNEN